MIYGYLTSVDASSFQDEKFFILKTELSSQQNFNWEIDYLITLKIICKLTNI